jgi:hypothetical protein
VLLFTLSGLETIVVEGFMDLSNHQQTSLENGEAVPVIHAGIPCILVRADVFDDLKAKSYDDSDFTPRDAYPMIDRVMAEQDANDPTLDHYQQFRRHP